VDVNKYGAPPSDEELPPEELVLMLASRDPNSDDDVDFPVRSQVMLGRNGKPIQKIRMCILKAREKVAAKRAAGNAVRAQFKADYGHAPTADDMAANDVNQQYEDLLACEILVRACRGVERINSDGPAIYPSIFESAQWMLDKLESDEIGILFQRYLFTEITKGARDHVLDEDPITIKLWLSKVKRGMWALGPLASLASADLGELLLSVFKLLDRLESYGFPILDPQYLSLLSSSGSNLSTSEPDIISSGSQLENSIPTIDPEKAREAARRMTGGN
jgi:hypothetical protein